MKKTHWTAASMFFLTSGRTGGSRLENSMSHISFHLPPSYPFTKSIPNSNFYSTNFGSKNLSRYFGVPESRNLQELCTVAFEPNPQHTDHLKNLAANYSTCGIRFGHFSGSPSPFFTEWWRSLRLGSATRTQLATLPPTWPSWRWTSRTAWLPGELGRQAGPHLCLQALLHLYCVTIIIWQVSAHWTEPG